MTMIITIMTNIIIKMTNIIDKTLKVEYSNSMREEEYNGIKKPGKRVKGKI